MSERLSVTFDDSDTGTFDKHLPRWEDSQPRAQDEGGRIWMRPSLGPVGIGRTVAVPVDPGFVEVLKAEHFPFTLQASAYPADEICAKPRLTVP